jgi:hypothetical protein
MQKFETVEAAKEYATSEIGKKGCDIVEINGKKTWISSTSIPLEARFREPIEMAVDHFLAEMGMEDNSDKDDIVAFIGAEISTKLIEMIEKESPYGIECAYTNF